MVETDVAESNESENDWKVMRQEKSGNKGVRNKRFVDQGAQTAKGLDLQDARETPNIDLRILLLTEGRAEEEEEEED